MHPQDNKVPVCLLNPRDVPVTMYKGMTIGEIEELRSNDVPVDNVQKANTVTKLDPKKRQMLLSLAETIGALSLKKNKYSFPIFFWSMVTYSPQAALIWVELVP